MAATLLRVATGELRIGRGQEVLSALLGSCVGVGMLWPEGGCCGLAHCLLPESPEPGTRMGARYVNHAVPSLLAMMGVRAQDRHQVQVILAGGARMLGRSGISSAIGQLNIDAAHKALAAHGLVLAHIEAGGRRGRTLSVDCARRSYEVRPISTEFDHART
ncbi:hypothetical protein D3872_10590 [Massilia cavernae]|uniref:Chemoreceptor glutamine deamidase CheD n=2 Tax=Massilia cavernae TaxID=2320864 RepID=A0A418XW37_9BURK|nr:hypothetical protein D3872_10590 [Massilia cavernae]